MNIDASFTDDTSFLKLDRVVIDIIFSPLKKTIAINHKRPNRWFNPHGAAIVPYHLIQGRGDLTHGGHLHRVQQLPEYVAVAGGALL